MCVCVCVCVRVRVCVCVCVCVRVHVCMHLYINVCACMHACIQTCMCTYMCIHTYMRVAMTHCRIILHACELSTSTVCVYSLSEVDPNTVGEASTEVIRNKDGEDGHRNHSCCAEWEGGGGGAGETRCNGCRQT